MNSSASPIADWLRKLAELVGGFLSPEPRPVLQPIPVRARSRRYRRG